MIERNDLQTWVVDALSYHGGKARLINVARHIWENHEEELRQSDDTFYKSQYEMRWAAMQLRKKGKLKSVEDSKRGVWEIN